MSGPVTRAIRAVRTDEGTFHRPVATLRIERFRQRRGPNIRPFDFSFPSCDEDWTSANLPVLRAAIGILGQDGPSLVAVHYEATQTDPFYTRRIVGDLNQRIAHFEMLAKAMRMARDRVETAAAYADAIESAQA